MLRMSFEVYRQTFTNLLNSNLQEYDNLEDMYLLLLNLKDDYNFVTHPEIKEYALKVSKFAHEYADVMATRTNREDFNDLYYNLLLYEAPDVFESYMLYTEKDREPEERFYLPRKRCFDKIGIIQAMQDLEDGKYEILCISMPPGTAKTTLGEFFMSWVMGRKPTRYNLVSSHSGYVTEMFHRAVKDIITSDEYKWSTVFPGAKVERINEKESTINLNRPKPFASLTCRAIGATQTGATRCNGYLYCDDLISGLEEALSPERLEKKYQLYATDLKTRKKENCKEIHIANRTSVNDVIGHIEKQYAGDDTVRMISIPDIDPDTGESNFDYDYGVGFSTKYFNDMELALDDVTYKCMFKNQPIEREGLLYHDDDFERFFELPDREPDAILGVCDTKDAGKDYCFLPILYQYGEQYYWWDCVYDNGPIEVCDALCADVIIRNNPHTVQFESNAAGGRTADSVNNLIKGKCRTKILKKYTTQNKETKIIVNSGWIKEHILLRDKSTYQPKSPYGQAVSAMMAYSQVGRNQVDHVPDGLAMFAEFVSKHEDKPTRLIRSPLGG